MKYVQLCRSYEFERICNEQCGQYGSFALITTEDPSQTENRLNGGWQYWTGPRKGTRSPPLGYCTDWRIERAWVIGYSNGLIIQTAAFWALFDRPCALYALEKRLMADDNRSFPNLRAKKISKNGLECVACLKSQTYPLRSETESITQNEYDATLTTLIVERLNTLFGVLRLNISEFGFHVEETKFEEEIQKR